MRRGIVTAGLLAGLAATLAVAAAAGAGSVNIGIQIGGPPPPPPAVVVAAPPPLVVVPGTPVYYAPALSVNFFYYGGRYYTFHEGAWFSAIAYNGPWVFAPVARVPRPVLAVPVRYYKVPPGHGHPGGPPPWAGPKHGHKGRKGGG